jgi:Pregnancy-associated plasma protein-A
MARKTRKPTRRSQPSSPGELPRGRTCGTMDHHRWLAYRSPEYRWRRRQIEIDVKNWIHRYAAAGLRSGVIRIPVVVHVVWNTAAQNVSDAQINSQIAILNEDYRRLNADAGLVPAAFAPVAADARIEFQLAVRDPNCAATTGITRTSTATVAFTYATRNDLKSAATGGANPWPSDRYLNIWVANFTGGFLGYGTYPGEPTATDGVVIYFRAFGNMGTATAPFDRGRTATHEVGHWLNLLHIWGTEAPSTSTCSDSDEVADTPNQAIAHTGRPTFPVVSCSNGPNGDMFMNYMDYTDDACMFMFTAGQVARMNATLQTARAGILASDGLVPPAGTSTPDLWSKDNVDDTGVEPNPSVAPMWISDDIWVRRANDGLDNQDHQNPEYDSTIPNYVYVRVRNRACPAAGAQSGTVKLYWAKASPSLSWPAPWDGSGGNPLMGGSIGSQSVTVNGGDDEILVFPWLVPNPADYASFGGDQAHFCLLSRIETTPVAPFGMTSPETANLYANVQNNNNIVWKNISIVDEVPEGGRFASFIVSSFAKRKYSAQILFTTPREEGPSLFDWGHLIVESDERLFRRWSRTGKKGEGAELLRDSRLLIARSGVSLNRLQLNVGEFNAIKIRFMPNGGIVPGARVFAFDVTQLNENGEVMGGQRFYMKTGPSKGQFLWDCAPGTFDGVNWNGHREKCSDC